MSHKVHKRLIIACDGTWVNSDNNNGYIAKDNKGVVVSSNVTRICRALVPETKDTIQQIVYYQGGLGSQSSFFSYLFGGYLGSGLGENIREAYAFLCNNYDEGDEIFLLGFSRGAFTARSIGGLIGSVGLLTRHGLGSFYAIFSDWEHQNKPDHKPEYETNSLPKAGRPHMKEGDTKYFKNLVQRGLTRREVPPIKAIGVWDTVGSLGVPTMKLFGLSLWTGSTAEYSFVNTEVAPNVENAYQALALDEVRTPFQPTVWESPALGAKSQLKELKQTWFPGVHSSVGGGYPDTSISDITLAWMITQLSDKLEFDPQYVPLQQKQNVEFYKAHNTPVRPWAMGLLRRSDAGFLNTMTGRSLRTPGEYYATNPDTGKKLPRRLQNTCEFIHPSVRFRKDNGGKGLSGSENDTVGQGSYTAAALKGWTFKKADDADDVGGKQWQGYGKWIKDGTNGELYIVEEDMYHGTVDTNLMQAWPGVEEKLYPWKVAD